MEHVIKIEYLACNISCFEYMYAKCINCKVSKYKRVRFCAQSSLSKRILQTVSHCCGDNNIWLCAWLIKHYFNVTISIPRITKMSVSMCMCYGYYGYFRLVLIDVIRYKNNGWKISEASLTQQNNISKRINNCV